MILGNDEPTGRFSFGRVHIHDRFPFPVILQIQPVPDTRVAEIPSGRVSSTVVVPVAATGPRFFTSNV